MIYCDSHSHTSFSTDSQAKPEDQIRAAIARGLKHYYITDHMDLGYPDGSFVLDLKTYYAALFEYQKQFADLIQIHPGIELGLRPEPDIIAANGNILRSYPCDYAIGSIHVVDNMDPYYKEYWEGYGEEKGILRYYDSMYESISAFREFDALGHIDYIIRYCPSKGALLQSEDFVKRMNARIDGVLEILVSEQKALELNTAGWKYGLPNPHPSPAILKRFRQMGGQMVSVGSDGHKPEHIAWDFDRVNGYLRSNGFTEYVRFEKHEPIFEKL